MVKKDASKKKQFLLFALCSLIAMAVCFGVLFATVNSLENNSVSVSEENEKSKTPLTGESAEISAYLKTITENTLQNKFVKVNKYTDLSIDDASVEVAGENGTISENDKQIFIYAKNKIISVIDRFYGDDYVGVFGSYNEDMLLLDLPVESFSALSFSVGQADDEGNPVYDSESGELLDKNSYFITITVDTEKAELTPEINEIFSLGIKDEIIKKLDDSLSFCSVDYSEINIDELEICVKVDRLTDEIQSITLNKAYNITADLEFSDDYAVLGRKKVTFRYEVKTQLDYFYAGIRFSEGAVAVSPDGEMSLTVNAVIEDDSDYTVTFISSDEAIATVDEMGYVKGIKASEEPVTITVKLNYLGGEFSDTCLVYVKENEE